MLRTVGRVALGAFCGLVAATLVCATIIVAAEWAIAKGWTDRYDDVTLAMLMQALLMAGPIVGGWWMWTRR